MKYETKNIMLIIYLETLNIEWGQIDPKGNRRVNMIYNIQYIAKYETQSSCMLDGLL